MPFVTIDYYVVISIELIEIMPFKSRRMRRKSKFVTKRGLPFQLMKYADIKYNDELGDDVVLSNVASGAQITSLVDIGGGTSVNTRTGNTLQVSGFYARMIYEAASSSRAQFIRVMVYMPRFPNNATPPIDNVVNPPDHEEFIIWYDKTLLCPQNPGGGPGVLIFKILC